jgi:hypothetical protein
MESSEKMATGKTCEAFLSVLQRRSILPALFVYTWVASDLLNGWAQRQTHLRLVQTTLRHGAPPNSAHASGELSLLGPVLLRWGPAFNFATSELLKLPSRTRAQHCYNHPITARRLQLSSSRPA